MDIYDAQNHGANLAAPKYDHNKEPMPSRDELIARNSFGSPDNNPFMNRELLRLRQIESMTREKVAIELGLKMMQRGGK